MGYYDIWSGEDKTFDILQPKKLDKIIALSLERGLKDS